MSPSPTEPRPLLDALRAGTPLPAFPPDAVDRARALVRDTASLTAADVEALPEALAAAVLEGAVVDGHAVLPEALAASSMKSLAKTAKKALYRLRSRGVAVAEAPRPAAPGPPQPAPTTDTLPALVTLMSSDGEFGLLLSRPIRGGMEVAQAVVSDERGVLKLTRVDTSRAEVRRMLKLGHENRYGVEVSQEEGAALLAEAAGANLRSHTPFPAELDTMLRHHGVQPRAEPAAPPSPEPDDTRHVLAGYQLHSTPEVAEWLPPELETRQLLAQVGSLTSSPLALSEGQRQEQLHQMVLGAARAFFTPEVRRRYGLRLWHMARFFEHTDRTHEAQVARGEARRLYHGPDEPFSSFAHTLFQKVLALAAAGSLSEDTEPTAPATGAPLPTERRSPGGLILP
ncbi:hypothetical protein JGU66_20980 [Myxococcaceae bacterium JPH2]|nr:hypothetical protein [Myxococcaceae bacterium JPH2]